MIEDKNTSTSHYKQLVAILGKNHIREKIESPFDFIHIAAKGVSAVVIKNFRDYFNVSREDAANMLNISSPTLYRWIKANKNLDRNYSVQLFELTDLFLYGAELFHGKETFMKWLQLPNTALGGLEPQELIEIPGGISKVKDALGRIEHGVYS